MIYKKPFSNYGNIWIETTEDQHEHGGQGWEYGTCLWSPTTDKSGKKIYEIMRDPRENDLVIHFYLRSREKIKKLKNGGIKTSITANRFIEGFSYVAKPFLETSKEPPKPGNWSGRKSYYRVNLKNYTDFKPYSTELKILTAKFDNEIRAEIKDDSPFNYPFIVYNNEIRLAQGKYLTRCTEKLFNLLSEIHSIGEAQDTYIKETGDLDKEFYLQDAKDHPQDDFIEGKRKRR